MTIIYTISAFIAGILLAWTIRSLMVSSEKKSLRDRFSDAVADRDEVKSELEKQRQRCEELLQKEVRLETEKSNLEEKLDTREKDLEELKKQFSTEFENLANRIFEEKSGKFTKQNRENITEILKPLNEKIKDFQRRVEETYDKESKQRFSLEKELKRLFELNEQVTKEANNLTNALRGESKVQGNWGEMILEKLLENSGLVRDMHFSVQQSMKTEDGKRLQPDVIIHLPEEKKLIIDSKVSLTAYEEYNSLQDGDEKDAALARHVLSVRKHIDELSAKNYQNVYNINTPDYVLMFIPVEPALSAAVRSDPALFVNAAEKQIAIVSPSILLATLKMVANIWRQENQGRNVREIASQSGALYDKFAGFINDLTDIDKNIKKTQESYDNAFKKLKTGKGNILTRIEKIKKLGAKTSKSLPQEAVTDSNEESDSE